MDEAKKELVRGWLGKASHDLAAARLLGTSPLALRDVAVYYCQQAAEKALKA
jgi:HEPN domain-containing protein